MNKSRSLPALQTTSQSVFLPRGNFAAANCLCATQEQRRTKKSNFLVTSFLFFCILLSTEAFAAIQFKGTQLDTSYIFKPTAYSSRMGNGLRLVRPVALSNTNSEWIEFSTSMDATLETMMEESLSFREGMIAASNISFSSHENMSIGFMPDPNKWLQPDIGGAPPLGNNEGIAFELGVGGRRSGIAINSTPGAGSPALIGFNDAIMKAGVDPAGVLAGVGKFIAVVAHEAGHGVAFAKGVGAPTNRLIVGEKGYLFEEIENVGLVPNENRTFTENTVSIELTFRGTREYAGLTFEYMKIAIRGFNSAPDTKGRSAWTEWSNSISARSTPALIKLKKDGCL